MQGCPRVDRVRVSGPSMSPTVKHGDRCWWPAPTGPAAGDVVLARFPARPELLVVKRLVRAVPGGWWVEGTTPSSPTTAGRSGRRWWWARCSCASRRGREVAQITP